MTSIRYSSDTGDVLHFQFKPRSAVVIENVLHDAKRLAPARVAGFNAYGTALQLLGMSVESSIAVSFTPSKQSIHMHITRRSVYVDAGRPCLFMLRPPPTHAHARALDLSAHLTASVLPAIVHLRMQNLPPQLACFNDQHTIRDLLAMLSRRTSVPASVFRANMLHYLLWRA